MYVTCIQSLSSAGSDLDPPKFNFHLHCSNITMVSKFGQAKDKCKTKTSNKNLKELVPSILPLKTSNNKQRHTRPSHADSSSSYWILTSCQPHRVTPGQSNSGHKQIHISKLFSHIYINPLSSQSTKPITSQTQNIPKHQTQIFDVSPFNITPLKRAHRARTCWYHQHNSVYCWSFVWYIGKKKQERTENNKRWQIFYKLHGGK